MLLLHVVLVAMCDWCICCIVAVVGPTVVEVARVVIVVVGYWGGGFPPVSVSGWHLYTSLFSLSPVVLCVCCRLVVGMLTLHCLAIVHYYV